MKGIKEKNYCDKCKKKLLGIDIPKQKKQLKDIQNTKNVVPKE